MPVDISRSDISHAHATIRAHIRRTPVIEIAANEFGLGDFRVVLKLELLQHSGSFKARGAFTNLLLRQVPAAGVVAASGGNHGVAVAFAAHELGVPARIFVPTVASPAKLDRIRASGAELVIVGDRYDDALTASREWATSSGAMPIHAFDQPETLMGQGTTGLEFEEQDDRLDCVIAAVGGGGFIGGIAAWYADRVRVIGVEPELAPTLTRALAAGEPVDAEAGGIAADSLAPKRVGTLAFPIIRDHVERVILVTDAELEQAQRMLWSTLRVAAEPGGAAAFAALLSGRYSPASGERVGVLVCGGNTSAVNFNPSAS
jgi:threonine dehydratase